VSSQSAVTIALIAAVTIYGIKIILSDPYKKRKSSSDGTGGGYAD
jgi:hypothetical protein